MKRSLIIYGKVSQRAQCFVFDFPFLIFHFSFFIHFLSHFAFWQARFDEQ